MINLENVVIEKQVVGKRLPVRNRTKKGELPWNARIVAGEQPGSFIVHFPANRVSALATERQATTSESHLIGGKEIGTLGMIALAAGDPITLKLNESKHKGIVSINIELLDHRVRDIDLIPAVVRNRAAGLA